MALFRADTPVNRPSNETPTSENQLETDDHEDPNRVPTRTPLCHRTGCDNERGGAKLIKTIRDSSYRAIPKRGAKTEGCAITPGFTVHETAPRTEGNEIKRDRPVYKQHTRPVR